MGVLITGAGRGVGRGIARALGGGGTRVAVTARRVEAAREVAAGLPGALGLGCDVTRWADVEAAVKAAAGEFGRLDAVIHNATSRFSSVPQRVSEITEEAWEDLVAVGLRGLYYCARAALPHLVASRGCLLVLTSTAALEGSASLPAYSGVKGAQRGIVKSLAREWGPLGVRVNALAPMATTEAMAEFFRRRPDMAERLASRAALGRLGDPELDVGRAAAFLIGPDAGFVTGQTLVVNGGAYLL